PEPPLAECRIRHSKCGLSLRNRAEAISVRPKYSWSPVVKRPGTTTRTPMEAIRIRGGHRFRIKHAPSTERASLKAPSTVGLTARGLDGVKPKVVVKQGDVVKRGDVVFHDKKRPDVKFTA